jgi:hypothetical protein
MTWTKLGDEFSDEARDLTDAEHRTHIDALNWSNRRGLDLLIPKRDLRKFGESPDAAEAVDGLVAKEWWADEGEAWNIGLRFPEWQLERAVIEKRREASALRMRRSRLHKADDHSLCLAENCPAVTRNTTRNDMRDVTRDPVRFGSGLSDPPEPLLKDEDQIQDQKTPAGAGGDGSPGHAEAAPVKTGSAAKSQNRRLPDGSETIADDDQQWPNQRAQSPAADRNAGTRERFGRTVSAGAAFDERFAELRREHERQARELAAHPEAS